MNYKYRMHDPRIGRFFATDPLEAKFPYWTPYAFSANRLIDSRELEGLEPLDTDNPSSNGFSAAYIINLPNGGQVTVYRLKNSKNLAISEDDKLTLQQSAQFSYRANWRFTQQQFSSDDNGFTLTTDVGGVSQPPDSQDYIDHTVYEFGSATITGPSMITQTQVIIQNQNVQSQVAGFRFMQGPNNNLAPAPAPGVSNAQLTNTGAQVAASANQAVNNMTANLPANSNLNNINLTVNVNQNLSANQQQVFQQAVRNNLNANINVNFQLINPADNSIITTGNQINANQQTQTTQQVQVPAVQVVSPGP